MYVDSWSKKNMYNEIYTFLSLSLSLFPLSLSLYIYTHTHIHTNNQTYVMVKLLEMKTFHIGKFSILWWRQQI